MKRIFPIIILFSFLFLTCEDNVETLDPILSIQPTSIDVSSTAGTSPSINVTCNNHWVASANTDWLSLSTNSGKGNGSLTVSYIENTQTAIRSGKVIVTSKELTKEITINQAATRISTSKPTVTTQSTTFIGAESVSITGNITDLGGSNIIEHGHCWSISPDPTNTLTTKTTKGSKDATGEFISSLDNLQSSTKYYVRAYATNVEGTSYSQEVNFTTISGTAVVSVSTPTNIDYQTITANGNVTNLGSTNPTQHGFVWSKISSTPTISDNDGVKELGSLSSTGTFSSSIADLIAATDYYIRAFVINSFGTTYSDASTFKTKNSFTDSRDGQAYKVIQIGDQIWMAENLNYHANNTIGLWYNNLESYGDIYGRLYSWYEANNDVCPSNWHLPNINEIKILVDYLGGIDISGGKLKEGGTSHWTSPNTGATNESNFTALPAGEYAWGTFQRLGERTYFFTADEGIDNTYGAVINLMYNTGIAKYDGSGRVKEVKLSVRCIKN